MEKVGAHPFLFLSPSLFKERKEAERISSMYSHIGIHRALGTGVFTYNLSITSHDVSIQHNQSLPHLPVSPTPISHFGHDQCCMVISLILENTARQRARRCFLCLFCMGESNGVNNLYIYKLFFHIYIYEYNGNSSQTKCHFLREI